ncbi:MAG TPA: cation efflux family transporter, partial [Luteimonas sp.]|nr:cation efflux family transporter [Luteimonas sp.]
AELVVIFGEDSAALMGLTLALLAVLLAVATGNPLWDALGTLAIGTLLIVVAVFVAVQVKAMLVGQSIDPERLAEMRAFFEAEPAIARLVSLITLQLGSEAMVSVQAEMRECGEAGAMVAQINAIERGLKAAFPEVRWSFFEPELPAPGLRTGTARDRTADAARDR